MKIKQNRIAALLALSIAACTAASCGETAQTPVSSDETAEPVSDTVTEAVTTDYLETLDIKDYDGKTFTLLGPYNADRQTFAGETETGELVNDALFRRDRETEELFNIKLETILAKDPTSDASKSAMAGDDSYQVVIGTMAGTQKSLALKSFSMNLLDMPHLQLDRPWWCSQVTDNLTVSDTMFFTTGPITPQFYFGGQVMAVNEKLAADYKIGDVKKDVINGEWTLDKLAAYLKGTGKDVDGNGQWSEKDNFGLVMEASVGAFGFYVGAGQKLCQVKNDSISVDIVSEKSVSLINRLNKLWSETTVYDTYIKHPDNHNIFVDIFTNGQSLFVVSSMSHVIVTFRSMEDDYIILPMPKEDVSQEAYHTYSNPWCLGGVSIPITVADADMTGSILETMAYLSWKYVRPAQYDLTLKSKVAREPDAEQSEILDLIFDNSYYDLNGIFQFGNSANLVMKAITGQTDSFASDFESIKNQVNDAINTYLSVIR